MNSRLEELAWGPSASSYDTLHMCWILHASYPKKLWFHYHHRLFRWLPNSWALMFFFPSPWDTQKTCIFFSFVGCRWVWITSHTELVCYIFKIAFLGGVIGATDIIKWFDYYLKSMNRYFEKLNLKSWVSGWGSDILRLVIWTVSGIWNFSRAGLGLTTSFSFSCHCCLKGLKWNTTMSVQMTFN